MRKLLRGTRGLEIALWPAPAPTAALTTGAAGSRAGEGTRPAITAGPAVGRVQIEPGPHLGETELDVGETAARGRRIRATGRSRRYRPRGDASSAAAAAEKLTADVQGEYEHLGPKHISRIYVLPFLSSTNPSDAGHQLTRSVKASASDILVTCNDGSREGLSSTDWIPGWENPLTTLIDDFFGRCRAPSQPEPRGRRRSRSS